jgi:hypothetical protein
MDLTLLAYAGLVFLLGGIAWLLTQRIIEAVERTQTDRTPRNGEHLTMDALNDRIGAAEQEIRVVAAMTRRNENEVKGCLGKLGAISRAEKKKTAELLEEEIVESLPSNFNDNPVDRLKRRLRRR